MKPVSLITAWKAERKAGVEVLMHSHAYYELVYYYRGSGTVYLEDQAFSFSGQTVSLIPPNTPHRELHQADGFVCCIEFQSGDTLPALLFQDSDRCFQTIADTIVREISLQPFRFRSMLSVKLQELLLQLQRVSNSTSKSATKDFQYVVNYLTNNYFEKIQLQQFAQDLHISYDYFQHRFKALTGQSPQQFLIRQRLSAAEALLRSTSCSCTEVALRCGFSTSAQFSMLFKRAYGVTPLQFRAVSPSVFP